MHHLNSSFPLFNIFLKHKVTLSLSLAQLPNLCAQINQKCHLWPHTPTSTELRHTLTPDALDRLGGSVINEKDYKSPSLPSRSYEQVYRDRTCYSKVVGIRPPCNWVQVKAIPLAVIQPQVEMEGKGTDGQRRNGREREQKCRKQALSTACVHCCSSGNVRKPRNPHKCCHSYANHGKNLRVAPWALGSQGSHCHCDKGLL